MAYGQRNMLRTIAPTFGLTGAFGPQTLVADGIPASIDVNFEAGQFPSNITVARSSNGWAADSSGNWHLFGPNVARQVDLGLLSEEARIQLITDTNMASSNWAPNQIIMTGNQPSPDLSNPNGASLIQDTNSNTTHFTYFSPDVNVAIGTDVTQSFLFKPIPGGIRYVGVFLADAGVADGFYANADLQLGVITATGVWGSNTVYTSSGIQVYPNGWIRVWVVGHHATLPTLYPFAATLVNGTTPPNVATYIGSSQGVYAYCPQTEVGTFPTSIMPNPAAGTTFSRPFDGAVMPITTAGTALTLFGDGLHLGPTGYGANQFLAILDDGQSNTNRVALAIPGGSTGFSGTVSTGTGPSYGPPAVGFWPFNTRGKGAISYTPARQNFAFNGTLGSPNTTALPFNASIINLRIGCRTPGDVNFNGYVKRVAVWLANAISDTGIQGLATLAPSWALTPDVTADFDFIGDQGYNQARTSNSTSLLTVSRNLPGYAVDSLGNLILFGNNVARRTDLGLTAEEQRTNLTLWSQSFGSGHWGLNGGATVADNVITAPDGTLTAANLNISSAAQLQANSFTSTAGHSYVMSCHFKKNLSNTVTLQCNLTSGGGAIDFNFATKTAAQRFGSVTNIQVQQLANGWFRVSGVVTEATSGNGAPYITDYNNGSATNTTYAWGYQIEDGINVTSYIPTTNAPVTRPVDAIYVPLQFSTNALTLFAQGVLLSPPPSAGTTYPSMVDAGPNPPTGNDVADIFVQTSNEVVNAQSFIGGVAEGQAAAPGAVSTGVSFKAGASFTNTSVFCSLNGAGASASISGLSPLNASFGIARFDRGGGNWLIKRATAWGGIAVPATQLNGLTT